jgi:hypothetical protein
VPPWTASIGVQYNFHLIGDSTYVRGDYQYTGHDTALTPATDPRNSIYDPGAITPQQIQFVGARVGVIFGNLNVSIFGDNLLDDHSIQTQFHNGAAYDAITIRPRTFGVTLTYRR